jgi:hypothetical protein
METIDVIFRATRYGDHAGEVTAVFPAVVAGKADECSVYAHVGQHGAGSRSWYRYGTRTATPAEYEPLLKELRGIYERDIAGEGAVKLRIVSRWTREHDEARLSNYR